MAGHLARTGYRVTVYNRSPERALRWVREFGGHSAVSPAAAARDAAMVFACVGNDDDLRQVTLGSQGAFPAMAVDAIFVDHTTASAQCARELYRAARESGLHFVDAPVCGGDIGPFERAQPLIHSYARAVNRIGASGAGQLAKMVDQLCVAGVLQGLAEGTHFGQRAGLDMGPLLDVIGKGAAQSWQLEHRGPTMIEGRFDFGFAVLWMGKDLAICLEEARRNGASLPLAAPIDQFYAEIEALGGARWDSSSLIQRLRHRSAGS